ncbi:MAG TPA: aspartate aminotransferase family protein [Planctomycetota bacterium]|nr:aspartate aminotransferase family protein [Planctomycetota bacterium]HUV38381.1 aspartate aminotransferase family protein [Planctomycetota bacterium]
MTTKKVTTKSVIRQFEKYVIGNYGRLPVVIVRGKGVHVWDADGREYLDMFPGWAVSGIGHCHARVVRAVRDQVGRLIHVANNFYSVPQGDLAEWISRKSFGGKCFFCNSGAEANEAAIKLARIATPPGKNKIITMHNSFHGRTLATIKATAQPKYQKGFEPLPQGFGYVPFGDLHTLERAINPRTCAVMLEPIQGEGGINVASDAYLKGVRRLCDRNKILLIFDEVQTGMGRTGEYFGYQHSGVVPDIMTLAKSLGGGVAIGAMTAKADVAAKLVPGTHASTFGGNALAAAAACATFEAIEKGKLIANTRRMSTYAFAKLAGIAKRHDVIEEVRGKGLMIGIELAQPGAGVVARCMRKGMLINCTHDTVLRFMPPMIVKKSHIDRAMKLLDEALTEEFKD